MKSYTTQQWYRAMLFLIAVSIPAWFLSCSSDKDNLIKPSDSLPVITTEPLSVTANVGDSAKFSVIASGSDLHYLWQKNNITIDSLLDKATYTKYQITANDSGRYRCIVYNAYGRDTSLPAVLTVITPDVAPVIILQPKDTMVAESLSVSFKIISTGKNLTYQWYKDTTPIVNALTSVYTIPSTTFADSGTTYKCKVTNLLGTVMSMPAKLGVILRAPVITVQPQSVTVAANAPVLFRVKAWGSLLTYQWMKNGVPIVGPSANKDSLNLTATPTDSAAVFTCSITNRAGVVTTRPVKFTISSGQLPVITAQPQHQQVALGKVAIFSVSAIGGTLHYQWHKNGAPIVGAVDAPTYTIPVVVAADNNSKFSCKVSNELGFVMSAEAMLTVITVPGSVPSITGEPRDTSVALGSPAQFSVAVTGTGVLLFQWYRNDTAAIPNAISAIYSITRVSNADTLYTYRCIVKNEIGSDTSKAVRIHIIPAKPTITTQPRAITVNLGATARFTVRASGTNVKYQWQKNGINLIDSNALKSIYTTLPTTIADNNSLFRCIVANAGGADTSDTARLIISENPVITAQPINDTVLVGTPAVFSITANSAFPPLTYQWYKNGTPIPGATAASYTTTPVTEADNATPFYCIVTNALSKTLQSSTVYIVILPKPPVIIADPLSQTIAEGSPVTFKVSALGMSLRYQWQMNGANLSWARDSIMTIDQVAKSDSGYTFRCIVSNSAGKDTSAAAILSVKSILNQ